MATIRQRASGSWEVIIRRKGILPRAHSATAATEANAIAYAKHIEGQLDQGIMPVELLGSSQPMAETVLDWVRPYLQQVAVSAADRGLLHVMFDTMGGWPVSAINMQWAQAWITAMKRDDKLSPSSIRHKVGAVARLLDWCVRNEWLNVNPLRLLPKRFLLPSWVCVVHVCPFICRPASADFSPPTQRSCGTCAKSRAGPTAKRWASLSRGSAARLRSSPARSGLRRRSLSLRTGRSHTGTRPVLRRCCCTRYLGARNLRPSRPVVYVDSRIENPGTGSPCSSRSCCSNPVPSAALCSLLSPCPETPNPTVQATWRIKPRQSPDLLR